jgi:hypothetical protein
MTKGKVNKYGILFSLFSINDIAIFLKEISLVPSVNYVINETNSINVLFSSEKPSKKNDQLKKFSTSSMKILNIINHFRNNHALKSILRYLEYEIYLRTDKIKVNDSNNCGIVVVKKGKKLDLSLENYLNQLKEKMFSHLEENYGK